MGIQKFVFFSIHNCDKHPEVPLMEIKYCTEKFFKDSGINHVIIRSCGFMEGIIVQYVVPILEDKSVWAFREQMPLQELLTWTPRLYQRSVQAILFSLFQ